MEGCLPKLLLCHYSAPNPPQPVLLCFLSRFSLTPARRWNDSLTVVISSAAETDTQESRPLAEAAALSALGRGSGPFRAMFTEARHRPFVMVSMCVCKRACAWGIAGGGWGRTTEKWSHLSSCRCRLVCLHWPTAVCQFDLGVSLLWEHFGFSYIEMSIIWAVAVWRCVTLKCISSSGIIPEQ